MTHTLSTAPPGDPHGRLVARAARVAAQKNAQVQLAELTFGVM